MLLVLSPLCGWRVTPVLPPMPGCGGSQRQGTSFPWLAAKASVCGMGWPLSVASHPGANHDVADDSVVCSQLRWAHGHRQ